MEQRSEMLWIGKEKSLSVRFDFFFKILKVFQLIRTRIFIPICTAETSHIIAVKCLDEYRGFLIIGVPTLRRGWRPWCAIFRVRQVPSHCTVPYSFLSSCSRCQSNSFFFVLCLFFPSKCPPTLIFFME